MRTDFVSASTRLPKPYHEVLLLRPYSYNVIIAIRVGNLWIMKKKNPMETHHNYMNNIVFRMHVQQDEKWMYLEFPGYSSEEG